jgi:hypothetical protein
VDNSKIVFLINDQARAIMATYEPGAPAEMFKTLDDGISVGDLAVVQSTTRHMMTVVKVTAVDVDVNFDSTTPLKWIVSRIDAPAFEATLAAEGQAISAVQAAELRRKKEELRKTMFADHEESIARLSLTSRTAAAEIIE